MQLESTQVEGYSLLADVSHLAIFLWQNNISSFKQKNKLFPRCNSGGKRLYVRYFEAYPAQWYVDKQLIFVSQNRILGFVETLSHFDCSVMDVTNK